MYVTREGEPSESATLGWKGSEEFVAATIGFH